MSRYIEPSEILVQERIPGGGENQFSFCAVCQNGRVRMPRWLPSEGDSIQSTSEMPARLWKRRTNPLSKPRGGNSSKASDLTDWPKSSSSSIPGMENTRFSTSIPRTWGWHTLGKAAGMDFSYLLWRQAVGLPVVPINGHRDAAWIREITDFVSIAKSPNRIAEVTRL